MEKWKLVPDAIGGPYMLANGSGAWVKADEALAKIAELEETLKSRMETTDNFCSRAVAAEAKLAMVANASRSLVNEVGGSFNAYEMDLRSIMGNTNYHCIVNRRDQLAAILSDTEPPLAVVEADDVFIDEYGEKYIRVFVGPHFYGVPGTVIVMARKE